ncbi:hypothetical protein ZWY2020_002981 [Hordeum vulgare]|nr:hypothetical protein ZWY2020_002981 [Hordeum vulgare]
MVELDNPYHTLLGRPTLANFTTIPHHAYLKLKMPGPKVIITVSGDYEKSTECARDGNWLAEALVITEEKRQVDRLVAQATEQPAVATPPSQPSNKATFQPSKDTKQVTLEPANPKQCVTIDATLNRK